MSDQPPEEAVDYEVSIDGKSWYSLSPHSEYDTIHCVAGAILAGAEEVTVEKVDGDPDGP